MDSASPGLYFIYLRRQSCPYLLPSAAFPSILVFFLHLSTGLLKTGSPGNQGMSDRECGSQQKNWGVPEPCRSLLSDCPSLACLHSKLSLEVYTNAGSWAHTQSMALLPRSEVESLLFKTLHQVPDMGGRGRLCQTCFPCILLITRVLKELLPPLSSLPRCRSLQATFSNTWVIFP